MKQKHSCFKIYLHITPVHATTHIPGHNSEPVSKNTIVLTGALAMSSLNSVILKTIETTNTTKEINK